MYTHSTLYKYLPLENSSHIRILHLRQSGHGVDDFKCSIEHIDVSKARFSALSYAWGSPEKPYRIRVLDQKGKAMGHVPLTMSLHNALKDLHNCDSIQPRRFWIDQICINQEDEKEKSVQVAMMGSIYKTAMQVITYLGPAERYDQEAIDITMKIYYRFKEHFAMLDYLILTGEMIDDVQQEAQVDIDFATPGLPNLKAILFGPWTQRLWMIPENICNKNTIMLRGTKILLWIAVAVVASLFSVGFENAMLPKNLQLFAIITAMRLARIRRFRSHDNHLGDTVNELGNLMRIFKDTCYSDKRDIVYALLALASDAEQLGIVPDYSKSTEQVLKEIATRIIESHDHFWFPSCCFQRPSSLRPSSLPSWVPWFESRLQPMCDVLFHQNASAGRTKQYRLENDGTVLVLKGLIIGRAQMIIELNDKSLRHIIQSARRNPELVEEVRKLHQAVAKVRERCGENNETDAKLGYTFLQDSEFTQKLPENQLGVDILFRYYLLHVEVIFDLAKENVSVSDRETHSYHTVVIESNDRVKSEDIESFEEDGFRNHLWEFLRNTEGTAGRSFCITDSDQLALVLDSTEPEDVVAILLGGSTAYILRPVGDMYRLVSDAFVHGFMNGEAFEDPDWEQKLVDFRMM